MTKEEIISIAEQFCENSKNNYVSDHTAISEELIGMRIFEAPIFAFGYPDDECYTAFKKPEAIGGHFLAPSEWLSSAKTVIAFFLPFTNRIKAANGKNNDWPADEWLHGRFEGQLFLKELTLHIKSLLEDLGYESFAPSFQPEFKSGSGSNKYTSNWSERHIAFACGLGTFGLSKGLITEKGVCGRFSSIITELDLPKNTRPYKDIYEYCTMCGACIVNCPVAAITMKGKDDAACAAFLDKVMSKHSPRYGCGKCQVNLPCESLAPGKQP